MAKDGRYYVTNFGNSMCRSFTHSKRHGIMESLKEKSYFFYILQLKYQVFEIIDYLVNLAIMKLKKIDFYIII